jgi:hypothetical protein
MISKSDIVPGVKIICDGPNMELAIASEKNGEVLPFPWEKC